MQYCTVSAFWDPYAQANDKAIGHHCTLSQLWLLIPKLLQNGGELGWFWRLIWDRLIPIYCPHYCPPEFPEIAMYWQHPTQLSPYHCSVIIKHARFGGEE